LKAVQKESNDKLLQEHEAPSKEGGVNAYCTARHIVSECLHAKRCLAQD